MALRQLLGAHSDYDGEASTVVPLCIPKLALPNNSTTAQAVLGEPTGPYSAEGLSAKYLRSNFAAAEAMAESDFSKPYLDPGLKSKRRYAELLCRLLAAGMLSLGHESGKSVVGLFTVRKKDGMLRVVIDAWPANFFFEPPPTTSLPTGAAFSRIPSTSEGMHFSGLDLKVFSTT